MRRLGVIRWQYALCCWGFCACVLTVSAVAQEIVLKAWTIGPDDPSVYRATNLQLAAERLNAELAQAGAPERVKVDTDFWSGEAIAHLPQRVEQGDFTLFDLAALAQQVKEAGIAPWGLYHHPTGGVDVFQIYLAFGGRLTDETGAQLVLNTTVLRELLQYH